MLPKRIAGANVAWNAPENWDESVRGKCSTLHARVSDGITATAWEPTPHELEILNAGGSVVLHIVGSQPPVALTVEEAQFDV